MAEAVRHGRGGWSTAVGLTLAVLFLAVFDALALVLIPLAILLVALPGARRWSWAAIGVVLGVVALLLPRGPLVALSWGWALVLGGVYLTVTLAWPGGGVLSRALATVGIGVAAGALGLLATGQAGVLDTLVREHFAALSNSFVELQTLLPESARLADMEAAAQRMAEVRSDLFPALLSLQSVAALALVAWWVRRLGRSASDAFLLGRMRDFRFNDQLIWLLLAGILFAVMPGGEVLTRVAVNVLVFIGALYVLRGLAIFVYLAMGTRSVAAMVFGALAVLLLYPIVVTAALLMGVGDTWLDVRGRVVSAGSA